MANLRDQVLGQEEEVRVANKGRSLDYDPEDFLMSQQEIETAVRGNKRRSVKLSDEDKIKLNCSHRGVNGAPLLKAETVNETDLNGNTKVVKKLVCPICGEVIDQISESDYRKIKNELPQLVRRMCNYIKAFDNRFDANEREVLATYMYETLLVSNILSDVIISNKKNNKQQKQRKESMTSRSIFR